VVTVGSYRRLLALPASLRNHTVAGARVEGGALQIRFKPAVEEQV
jgi:arsenite/tail-anchored protein-transporting ATPase